MWWLSPAKTRQYIDAEATLRALRGAKKASAEVRGSVFWRGARGRRYSNRVSSTGAQISLRPETPELQQLIALHAAQGSSGFAAENLH